MSDTHIGHRIASGGYSLVELAAVVSVLSILTAIAVPQVYKYGIELPKIDSAKSIVNSALADCLRLSREGGETQELSPDPGIISNELLEGSNYALKNSSCSNFSVSPLNASSELGFEFGFRVNNNGKVVKFGIPANDKASLASCKSWAGVNCTASAEQQDAWKEADRLASLQKSCNDDFFLFLNSGSKGQKNTWDNTSQSCTRAQWVLDGTRYTSKDAYDSAFTAKVGKECAASLAAYANNNPPNGPYKNEACDIDTYFLNGSNLESSDPAVYQAKQKEYNDLQCDAAEQAWLSDGKAGAFTWPAGLSCTAKWKCPAENSKVYLDLNSYNTSSCATPPPPPPPPACRIKSSNGICILR